MPPKQLNFAQAIGNSSQNSAQSNSTSNEVPKTIREFVSGGAKQKGIMPKQLSIDRLKMFSKDIDHLTSLLTKRRFGTVMWDTDVLDTTAHNQSSLVLGSTADALLDWSCGSTA